LICIGCRLRRSAPTPSFVPDEIARSALHLVVDLGHVLADDTEGDHQDRADQDQQQDHGREAGNGLPRQPDPHRLRAEDDREQEEADAQDGHGLKGNRAEADDRADREASQLDEGPARRAAGAGGDVEWKILLREAHPRDQPAKEGVSLGQSAVDVDGVLIQQLEVRAVLHRDSGELREQAVVEARQPALRRRFPATLTLDGVDDAEAFLLPQPVHLRNQLWRMLQVGVHHDDSLATARVQARKERPLLAEVARET
jgi:hypothetical protein